jgi:Uma2 family endonuclease
MATVETILPPQHFVLSGVRWEAYRELRDAPENEHARMTYDRGDLEIMSLSRRHERLADFIGRLVHVWTEESGIEIESCRSMTMQREDLQRGFEADNCYYVANVHLVRGKEELDFSVDPPPDLAIEIEVSRKAINKMAIYAAFGVPEVWRYDGQALQAYVLTEEGQYRAQSRSNCFPHLPLAEVERLLGQLNEAGETSLVKSFRAWVQARAATSGNSR